jgi:tetratricopeptide (TPR) repeat protein
VSDRDLDERAERFRDLIGRGRYRRAYALAEETLAALDGEEDEAPAPEVGEWFVNVAHAAHCRNRLRLAQRHYEDAVAIFEQNADEDPADLVASLRGLASVLDERGKRVRAGKTWKRALAVADALGPEHPTRLWVLVCLAEHELVREHVERALHLFDEAERLLEDGQEASLRRRLIAFRTRWADIAEQTGRIDSARENLIRALAIAEGAPDGSIDLAKTVHGLGLFYLRYDRWRDAAATFRRGVDWADRDPEARAVPLMACLSNLGPALAEAGDLEEADRAFARALEIAALRSEPSPGLEAFVQTGLGELRRKQGRLEGAEAAFRRARAIQEETGDHMLRRTLFGLGCVLKAKGETDGARKLLLRARRLYRQGDRPDRSMVHECELELAGLGGGGHP